MKSDATADMDGRVGAEGAGADDRASSRLFDAVVFDMDGVLCDSEPFICEAACRMFSDRYGVRARHEDFKPFTGMGENRFIGGVAEKYGVTLSMPADKVDTYTRYLELIKGRLEPLAGVVDFIAACRGAGLKLAVASSADRMKVDGNLAQIGVPAPEFDAVVTGSDVERKKPEPDIFLRAASLIGVSPSRCLVVEDAPSGVEAAARAGSACLGITSSFSDEQLRAEGAAWTAADLAHVPDALRVHLGLPR